MVQEGAPPPFDEFDAKLRELRERRDAEGTEAKGGRRGRAPSPLSIGFQAGIEILVGVVGGVAIGYGLDAWFGTRPVFLVVFFFLGSGAGLSNACRYLSKVARTTGEDPAGRETGREP